MWSTTIALARTAVSGRRSRETTREPIIRSGSGSLSTSEPAPRFHPTNRATHTLAEADGLSDILSNGFSSMEVEKFDVIEEDRRLRRAEMPLTVGIVTAVALLVGAGLVLTAVGALGRQWPLLGVGLAIAAVGGLLTRLAYRVATVRYTEVSVGNDSLTIVMGDGRRWTAGWSDPKFRVAILDYRENRHRGSKRYNDIPCQLLTPQFEVGLSVVAFEGIRAEAVRLGVAVLEKRTDRGVKAIVIGTGPELAAPFKQA